MQREVELWLPDRPEGEFPDLPDDPTDLSDSELMSLMVEMTRWAEYLSGQVALAEIDVSYAELGLEEIRALKGYDFRKTDVKGKAFEDDEFNDRQYKVYEAQAFHTLIKVKYDSADRSGNILSRELTRRVNRNPKDVRSDRWGT